MIRPAIFRVLGLFLFVFAGTMVVPLFLAILNHEDAAPLAYSVLVTAAAGTVLLVTIKDAPEEIRPKEGILLVVMTWLAASVFGALPFWFSPQFLGFTDAVFESTSGFTTTGATILPDVEVLPTGVQFWRMQTHWIGGIGVVILMVAVLPLVGVGGVAMYRAQFASARAEKLKPRIIDTAKSLWKVYVGLTLAETIALRVAGMTTYDAVTHAFSTIATGGFSTRTASIAAFESPAIEYIIILFMILASINFTRHFSLWIERSPGRFFSDVEVQFHLGLLALAAAAVYIVVALNAGGGSELLWRQSLFQVTSILTCTGFATYDFEQWPPFTNMLLLVLMYIGGNTGSTAGGIKSFRILLLFRIIQRNFRQMVDRRGVFPVRISGQATPDDAISGVMNLVYFVFVFNFAAVLLMTACGVDLLTSISAVASAMFGVGPGLGTVGPAENYAHLPASGKWLLSGAMLAGRLEFFAFVLVFAPKFWKR